MWAQTPNEFGKIIEMARRSRGLTQSEVAKATGSSQAWISEIEKGKERAHIGKILRVLSYLGVRLLVGEAPFLDHKITPPKGRVSLSTVLDAYAPSHGKKKAR